MKRQYKHIEVSGTVLTITPPGQTWTYAMSLAEFEHAGAFLSKLRHLRTKHWFTPPIQDEFMKAVETAFNERFKVNFYTLGHKSFDWDKGEITNAE